MRARHWEKIFKAVGIPYVTDMAFSLSMLVNGGIMLYKELITEGSPTF